MKSCRDEGPRFAICTAVSEETSKPANTASSILLVDDHAALIEVLVEYLNILGYRTEFASGGEEAVNIYREKWETIDLVLLDMMMPGMDGGEVFQALKQINPHVKAILTSGLDLEGRGQEILRMGCNAFIQKPFDLNELSCLIRETISSDSLCQGSSNQPLIILSAAPFGKTA